MSAEFCFSFAQQKRTDGVVLKVVSKDCGLPDSRGVELLQQRKIVQGRSRRTTRTRRRKEEKRSYKSEDQSLEKERIQDSLIEGL
jgi:hypothetical protein